MGPLAVGALELHSRVEGQVLEIGVEIAGTSTSQSDPEM